MTTRHLSLDFRSHTLSVSSQAFIIFVGIHFARATYILFLFSFLPLFPVVCSEEVEKVEGKNESNAGKRLLFLSPPSSMRTHITFDLFINLTHALFSLHNLSNPPSSCSEKEPIHLRGSRNLSVTSTPAVPLSIQSLQLWAPEGWISSSLTTEASPSPTTEPLS